MKEWSGGQQPVLADLSGQSPSRLIQAPLNVPAQQKFPSDIFHHGSEPSIIIDFPLSKNIESGWTLQK